MNNNCIYKEFILAKNGTSIPVLISGRTIESRYNPDREAENQIQSFEKKYSAFLILGIGSGILIKKIKETFAYAYETNSSNSETINVLDKHEHNVIINNEEITQVVKSRLDEILNLCNKEINFLTKKEISYIIFTGGLGECKDFKLLLNEIFGAKASLGKIKEIGARNNKYSSCIGLIKYYANNAQLKNKDFSIFSLEEQQELSGASLNSQNENVMGKLFG